MTPATLIAFALLTAAPGPPEHDIRAAVAKALPLIQKGAAGHMEHRSCFACHHQTLPVLAMVTARDRGVAVPADDVPKHLDFIAEFLDKNRDGYRKGRGQGGQADTAGYALWTLELGGRPADDLTAAVVEYLLQRDADRDHWRATSNRPPSEASPFTTTAFALRALQTFGTPAQKERVDRRVRAVRAWLLKTPAKDTEDRVFRLRALRLAGADTKDVQAAATDLIRTQRDDGGWGQLDGRPADAYATGAALVALHQAGGLATDDPAYRRGLRALLATQRDDGTWHVASRSKPFQTYFESGFPHGKDQFISLAATGWATTALALALPPQPTRPAGDD